MRFTLKRYIKIRSYSIADKGINKENLTMLKKASKNKILCARIPKLTHSKDRLFKLSEKSSNWIYLINAEVEPFYVRIHNSTLFFFLETANSTCSAHICTSRMEFCFKYCKDETNQKRNSEKMNIKMLIIDETVYACCKYSYGKANAWLRK